MAKLKTTKNDASVEAFLNRIADEKRRNDCFTILEMMKQVTKAEPKMWGTSIVGFGRHRYEYASGGGGDWFLVGFSPRKQDLTLYVMTGFQWFGDLMKKLGKHKTGVSCLYIKQLDDIDLPTLKKLIQRSVEKIEKSGK